MASFTENTVTGRKADGTKYEKAKYIEFVESFRVPGKKYPRHRVLWRKNKEQLEKAGWFDKMLLWFAARSQSAKAVSLDTAFVKEVAQWALPEAVRNLLEEAGILEKVRQLDEKGKHQYKIEDVVVGYVTMSFIDACSKLKYYDKGQKKIFGNRPSQLHQIYRAVRKLAHVDWLTLEELQQRWKMFKPPVELMLFDFTTVYWESEDVDQLRKQGWSKDGKPDKVQVFMAMVIDDRGLPIAMELFEGNSSEKVAIRDFIQKLSQKVDVREVVFVGDAGLYSNEFLEQLRSYGWKVIMRIPRNALSKQEKEEVLSNQGWEVMEADEESGEVLKEIKEMRFKGKYRLIAVRDYRLRAKQLHELEEFLYRLGLLDEDGSLKRGSVDVTTVKERLSQLTNRYMKGIVTIKGQEIIINKERIERLQSWAGISLFVTDVKWKAAQVVSRYGLLRRIESRWRDLKSGLHVRPVYHRNELAVRGHFTLKFFALQVAAYMEYKLRNAGLNMIWQQAVELLQDVQAVKVEFSDGTVGWARTDTANKKALEVMRALGVPTDRILLSTDRK